MMMEHQIDWRPTAKQLKALEYLNDKVTTELFFGGGAGGGKSYLGCAWLIIKSLQWPGSRWLMGRAILKSLKESTFLTFIDLCKQWKLISGTHFKYNSVEGVIKWYNGSEIYLKDLFLYPSDPQFDSLGSTEFTGAFIDEASQITNKAKNIVMSRLRYKLEEFNTIPKLLIASNPSKNFLYFEFYKPFKEKTLEPFRKFIPALVYDNVYISKHYIENLKKLDKISKERLLYGNFEYDDDPAKMIEYEKILCVFNEEILKDNSKTKYITVDPARFGQNLTVIFVWEGLKVIKVFAWDKTSNDFTERKIQEIAEEEGIPENHIVVDEDGVGGGIVDHFSEVKGFVNNSTAVLIKTDQNNYENLKTQCYYLLSVYINSKKIKAYFENNSYRELLIEDLEQVKRKDIDKDGKFKIVSKDEIKENIGRSPDFCFPKGTKILTNKGYKNIEEIKEGNKVITPFGIRKVNHVGFRKVNELLKLVLSNGKEIITTKNHKFYSNKRFIYADSLNMRDYLETDKIWNLVKWRLKKLLYIGERNIGFRKLIQNTIMQTSILDKVKKQERKYHYTTKYGKIIQVFQYLRDVVFIILMEIPLIIILKIWNWLRDHNIKGIIKQKDLKIKNIGMRIKKYWKLSDQKLQNGMGQKKARNGIKNIMKIALKKLHLLNTNVFYVIINMNQQGKSQNFAVINVLRIIIIKLKDFLRKGAVNFVKLLLKSKKVIRPFVVQKVVLQRKDGITVYNLTVDKDNVYYSNGILVSNSDCMMMRMYFELNKSSMGFLEDKENITGLF